MWTKGVSRSCFKSVNNVLLLCHLSQVLAKYVVVWISIHPLDGYLYKASARNCADSFSNNFLHVTVQACKFCNRAEPCNCFHQSIVERRRGVSWSTVRHLCMLLNMNAYLRCLLRNLICAFILSRFRKSRPWSRFLWIWCFFDRAS